MESNKDEFISNLNDGGTKYVKTNDNIKILNLQVLYHGYRWPTLD